MVKEIVKDIETLTQQSKQFNSKVDANVIKDLLDTAKAHNQECLGLAAIQIGYPVRCFVAKDIRKKEMPFMVLINPIIMKHSAETFEQDEGCLSLEGTRKVRRYNWIDVVYTDIKGRIQKEHLSGIVGEIVQHEYDHLSGKLI